MSYVGSIASATTSATYQRVFLACSLGVPPIEGMSPLGAGAGVVAGKLIVLHKWQLVSTSSRPNACWGPRSIRGMRDAQ